MELAYIDVPDDCTGSVIQKLSQRKGELLGMSPITVDTQDFSSLFLQEVLSDTEVNSLLILRVTVLSILLLKDMKNTKETFLTERMVLLLLTKAVMLSLMVFSMRRKEVLSSSDLVRRYILQEALTSHTRIQLLKTMKSCSLSYNVENDCTEVRC